MPKVTPLKASINAGEFSPKMVARSDFALYNNAAEILENMLVLPQGGATRRPGTRYVAEAKSGSGPYRLIPFERSADQAYVLEIGQGYMRFYTRQGQIVTGGSTPYEIATPWTSFDPFLLNWAQQDDIMILVHPDFPPQQLSRFAETNWTIAALDFDAGPLESDENTTSISVVASATTGTFTLTASAALFTTDHVGSLFGLGTRATAFDGDWETGVAIALDERRTYEGITYRATNAGTTGKYAPVHINGTASDGDVVWQVVQRGKYCLARITGFVSSTVVNATTVPGEEILQTRVTGGTTQWKFGAWNDERGYPRAVTLKDGRAWFGGTNAQPQTAWASTVGDFTDHHRQGTNVDEPITDDGAIEASLQSSQVSPILWLMVRDDIIAGTSSGPWRISSSGGGTITPTNIQAARQSGTRCSTIPALEANSALLFVPRSRSKLYDLRFDFDVDKFEAIDQTLLADHIFLSSVKQFAYQEQPLSTLWALRDDGVLATLAFNRAEAISGWSRQILGGTDMAVKSLAIIPGDDQTGSEGRDEVWVAVERTINSGTVTYVEFFEAEHEEADDVVDAWYLDAALQYSGASTTTISGLTHLEGESVSVWGDSGEIEADKTVASGSITLTHAVTKAIVGLRKAPVFKPLPMDAGSPFGTALTKKQKMTELRLILYLTCGIKVSQEGTKIQDVYDLDRRIIRSSPYERLTGQYAVKPRDASWRHNPQPTISSDTAGPLTVLGIIPGITTNE